MDLLKKIKCDEDLFRTEVARYQKLGYNPSEAVILAQESVKMGGFTFTKETAKQIISYFNKKAKEKEYSWWNGLFKCFRKK